MSVWIVPASRSGADALALRRDHVEGQHHRRRRVDRHRRRHLAHVDPAEQRLHVVERVDRHALAAHLALRARVVGVVAHQRRHVERRRQARLAVVEQVAEALVRLLRRPEAGELAHRPQPPAVHRRVHAARERETRPGSRSASSGPTSSGVYSGSTGSPLSVENSASRSGVRAIALAEPALGVGHRARLDCHRTQSKCLGGDNRREPWRGACVATQHESALSSSSACRLAAARPSRRLAHGAAPRADARPSALAARRPPRQLGGSRRRSSGQLAG